MKKLFENNFVLITALIVLQLMVCLPFITSFPVALDEPFSIFWAQQNWSDMSAMFVNENNPPLHFILLHFWIKLFGIGPVAVRSLSLLFSVLTTAVLFKFSLKILSRELAVFIVLVFISTQFNHYHAIEARTYSLLVLIFSLILFDLFQLLFENKNVFWRLAIWNGLLLYTHYIGPLIIGVELLLILIFIRNIDKKRIGFFVLSYLGTMLIFLPGIKLFLLRLNKFTDSGTWVPDAQYSELYGNVVRFFNGKLIVSLIILLVVVFVAIFRKSIFLRIKLNLASKNNQFVFYAFVLSYFGMFIFSKLVQPVFLDRYLLFTTIPLLILFGIFCQLVLPRERHYFALALLIPLAYGTNWLPSNNRAPDEEVIYIKQVRKENSAVLICPPYYDLTFLYHYDRSAFANYQELKSFMDENKLFAIYSLSEKSIIEGREQIIFIDNNANQSLPHNGILSELGKSFYQEDALSFKGGTVIYSFRKL